MSIPLYDYQVEAISNMHNGCILCGGVGSGKSRTALAYFYKECGGDLFDNSRFKELTCPKNLYIITTAHKRDNKEWELEMAPFLLSECPENNKHCCTVKVDSWNNIEKYREIKNSFFIFDEQRVVGSGKWVKAFIEISKSNNWILLSATPGDSWMDYIPVFIANGFYRNKKHFCDEHVSWSRYTRYPKVDRYFNTGKLSRLRDSILVNMAFKRSTIRHHEEIIIPYDIHMYKSCIKNRWNPFEEKPIENASNLCYTLRKIVNGCEERSAMILEILENHTKAIIFYNFDYELDILKSLSYAEGTEIAEWNGHEHQPIPSSNSWVYLVQYTAGCEGWNCIETDTIIFYSQSYSYKVMEQASGRIDRLNTPYTDLYYYHLTSKSGIDLAISRALKNKKMFNASSFVLSNSKNFYSKNRFEISDSKKT